MKREKKWTRQDASRPYSGSRACASGVFNARYPAEPQSAFADAGAVRKPTGWRFPVTRFGANQQAHAWFRNCKTFSHSCDSNAVQRALHPRPGLRRPGRLPASARCHLPLPLRFPLFFFVFPYTRADTVYSHTFLLKCASRARKTRVIAARKRHYVTSTQICIKNVTTNLAFYV